MFFKYKNKRIYFPRLALPCLALPIEAKKKINFYFPIY